MSSSMGFFFTFQMLHDIVLGLCHGGALSVAICTLSMIVRLDYFHGDKIRCHKLGRKIKHVWNQPNGLWWMETETKFMVYDGNWSTIRWINQHISGASHFIGVDYKKSYFPFMLGPIETHTRLKLLDLPWGNLCKIPRNMIKKHQKGVYVGW